MRRLCPRVHHPATGPGRGGFTLIELMVVVALALILITLAGPSIKELLAVQRLQNVHATLVTDLQFARAEAVRRRLPLLFNVVSKPAISCYVLYADSMSGSCDCTKPPGSACLGSHEELRTVQVLSETGVRMAPANPASAFASFDKDSGYSKPGDFSIDITHSPRGSIRVRLNSAGHVSSCSPDGSVKQLGSC